MGSNAERIADWDQLYPGRFFKAGELREGERRILTISDVSLEELEGNKGLQWKGILTLQGERMQLPLNKTNGICLRELFGRVPYKWVGHRFAIYASATGGFDGEPCIRIWGSPELTEDRVVTIELPRKKPFKMTMHAMGDERSLQSAGKRAARKLEPVTDPDEDPLGDRCQELLKMMAGAKNDDALTDIEADFATESFNAREARVLNKALAKRRAQLADGVIT